jgi:hypothetical protein
MQGYHRLDPGKDPKQIDIAGQLNGSIVIKGICVLDGDEPRLCLDEAGKDRPTAFPEPPKPGENTILKRVKEAEPQKAKRLDPMQPALPVQGDKPPQFVENRDEVTNRVVPPSQAIPVTSRISDGV